jgi:hypothetical protein
MANTPTNSTTRQNAATPTQARVTAQRTVTYTINTAASGVANGVSLRYAVAVDDVVLPAYANRVDILRTNGTATIRVTVDPGKKVSLFLNSDSRPGRRNKPVYAVTPRDKNVQVTIREVMGKNSTPDTPVAAGSDRNTDRYTAVLTGDIWMKITHKFTAADVDTLLPQGTLPEINAAVKSIMSGLPGRTLTMAIPSRNFSTTLTFGGNQNAANNINNFNLQRDGLPRVHPCCYAAILQAAVDANARAIEMSSNWRPLLGSIAHRCGLGCDVVNIDGSAMNNTAAANSRVDQLRRAYQANQTDANRRAWEQARDRNEAPKVQAFRRSLQQNSGVKQVLDPWQVDLNTRDSTAAATNVGQDATARQHLNHLHVTARDEIILP